MKVVSLFDGISAGQMALKKSGIEVDQYFSSEIDRYALAITQKNFPETIQMGDITKLQVDMLPSNIDLLIGGSPCTSFSKAGNQTGFEGESGLFWEYVRVLNELQPRYFLLENVQMKKEWEDIITEAVGVEPIRINSRLVSAQNRPRVYWTNIPNIDQPEDKNIRLEDILEENPDPKYNLSQKAYDYMSRLRNGKPRWEYHTNHLDGKAACLTANMWKGVPYGVIKELNRRLTPVECERLQTFPDNYTEGVSATQRYKMMGNSWTVDVISHIFNKLK